jgi:ABC-type cobalamin/Fe3+-siderophores transport system ATPase subunit
VEKGEISVLMGLSGSGKSTLLRAVNGLNKVTRGDVIVHDGDWQANVASCSVGDLRRIRRRAAARRSCAGRRPACSSLRLETWAAPACRKLNRA